MPWYHLMLDLYGCDSARLNDEELMKELFAELLGVLKVNVLVGPVIVRYVGKPNSVSGEGLSGFMIIAESHISIHTDIRSNYASIDVYSCKEFNSESVKELFQSAYRAREMREGFMVRSAPRQELSQAVLENGP